MSLQIQLKSLAEEMQAIIKGLEKVKQELDASQNDGPVSEVFRKVHNCFITFYSSTYIFKGCCMVFNVFYHITCLFSHILLVDHQWNS